MPGDAYLQVAPDSTGKLVDMELVSTAAGQVLYRQRAILVGESGNALDELLALASAQLAVLRAILATMQQTVPGAATEEEFHDHDSHLI